MIGEWVPAHQDIGAAMLARPGGALAYQMHRRASCASVVKALAGVQARATGPEAES